MRSNLLGELDSNRYRKKVKLNPKTSKDIGFEQMLLMNLAKKIDQSEYGKLQIKKLN